MHMHDNTYVRGVIRNKCAGRIYLKTVISLGRLFHVIFQHSCRQYGHTFPALDPLPKGDGELVLSDLAYDPIPGILEGPMGQGEASQLGLHLWKQEKSTGARSAE
jgi:hypothetical protein